MPFCSSRCRMIDLGGWLGGRYRIAGDEKVDIGDATSDADNEVDTPDTQ
jgi:endogenous inhibitor of DNA gyrase (YacG/DUF329 family)